MRIYFFKKLVRTNKRQSNWYEGQRLRSPPITGRSKVVGIGLVSLNERRKMSKVVTKGNERHRAIGTFIYRWTSVEVEITQKTGGGSHAAETFSSVSHRIE